MNSSWAALAVAVLTVITGVPVMNYLTERVRGNVALKGKAQDSIAAAELRLAERESAFEAEQREWRMNQQREMASLRVENRTMREDLTANQNRCVLLEAQLAATKRELADAEVQIADLTREVGRLTRSEGAVHD